MSTPTVNSDAEFWRVELDGERHGEFQTERDAWRWLMATLVEQRDAALAKAQTYEDEALRWHAEVLECLGRHDELELGEEIPRALVMPTPPKRPSIVVSVRYTAEEADQLFAVADAADERLTVLVKQSLTEYLIDAAAMHGDRMTLTYTVEDANALAAFLGESKRKE